MPDSYIIRRKISSLRDSWDIYIIFIYGCTSKEKNAKILHRKFETYIPRKGTATVIVPIPTFMFLCVIYIFPRSVYIFCCRKIGGPIVGIYCISRPQTHDCGNWDWGRAVPFLGIHKSKFLCSVEKAYGTGPLCPCRLILKGLSHEIDFKNFDKNLQNLV